MTNLEAIKASEAGKYQLSDNVYLKALTDHSIVNTATYAGRSQAFDLAVADVYIVLATGTDVKEGGYSVSIPDRKTLLNLANSIYQRWGYPIVGSPVLKVKAVYPW